jgi:hypothetical protein
VKPKAVYKNKLKSNHTFSAARIHMRYVNEDVNRVDYTSIQSP